MVAFGAKFNTIKVIYDYTMSKRSLLGSVDTTESPTFAFSKIDRDKTSERYDLDSVTVQGVTEDGNPFSMARIPVDEDDRVIISEEVFGNNTNLAWLVSNLISQNGWEYVEQ